MTGIEPVSYATPTPRSGARVWAGAVILFAGLAMIVLGGCFLIGVMLTVDDGFNLNGPTPKLTNAEQVLVIVLYGLAFASFGGAIWLFILAFAD